MFGARPGKSEFRSPALPAGFLYDVSAGARGLLGGKAAGVAPDGRPVTIVLRRGGRIEGRVLELDGTPVRGRVGVSARADPASGKGGDLGTGAQAVVKPDGSFVLEGLGDFPFRLHAGGEDYRCPADLPTVRPGEKAEIRVARGVALLGRIRGWTAADGSRLLVMAFQPGEPGRMAQVAPDGSFQVRALAEGGVRLEIYAASDPSRRTVLGTFTAPGSDVEAVLPEGLRAEGTPK
jgi:hypothetical protein